MAMFSGNGESVSIPCSVKECFTALKRAAEALSKSSKYNYTIDSVDEMLHRVTLKTGMSFFSWGENISITVSPAQDGTSVLSITSKTKTGAPLDFGKNNKNISQIMNELSKQLEPFDKSKAQISKQPKPTTSYIGGAPVYSSAPKTSSEGAKSAKEDSAKDSVEDTISALERLAKLKESGILTEEEFKQEKAKILNG